MDVRTPEELAASGKHAYEAGNYGEASQAYEWAARGYTKAGDELMAAEMANNQCVALLRFGEAEAALNAVRETPGVCEAAGDIRRQAMALGNLGTCQEVLKQFGEAEASFQLSANLFSKIGEDELRANVMQSLSKLQLRTGRQMEALASMQEGIEGLKHPNLRERLLRKLLRKPGDLMKRG